MASTIAVTRVVEWVYDVDLDGQPYGRLRIGPPDPDGVYRSVRIVEGSFSLLQLSRVINEIAYGRVREPSRP